MCGNEPLVFLCYQFLLDRLKASDFNGSLSRAVFEMMTSWCPISPESLEKTHLSKVLPRYVKSGDAKTKSYARRILAAHGEASKAGSASGKGAGVGSAASAVKVDAEPVAGSKRAAAHGTGEGSAAKKVALSPRRSSGASGENQVHGATTKKKVAAKTETAKPVCARTTPPTKAKQVVAKPSGLFSGLSASKKPGTSIASKKAAAAALQSGATAKPPDKQTQSPATSNAPASSFFSFSETMKNLSKPKEEKVATAKPSTGNDSSPPITETPAETTRRLRKESRRHLRVAFKPADDGLVEWRYFHHDPAEERGHDSSQTRDLLERGGEGRVLRQQQHHNNLVDVDGEDDDDEDLSASKDPAPALLPFDAHPLSQIDYTVLDPETRKANYAPSGLAVVKSPESAARDLYDANHLMVVYADPADVPPTPREPATLDTGTAADADVTTIPAPDERFAARAREKQRIRTAATSIQHGHGTAPTTAIPNLDISSILATLQNSAPTGGHFVGPGFPNVALPQHMHQAAQPQQQQLPAGSDIDLAAILAQITQQPGGGGGGGGGGHSQYGNGGAVVDPSHHLYNTHVCRLWPLGACLKGEACAYRHE